VKGLHAIRLTDLNGRKDRNVLGRAYEFFYNPMWRCYGRPGDPPATHYYYGYEVHELFWHLLDQVVLRPDLLPLFPEKRLRILGEAGGVSLLTERGVPDQATASDHLPVLFAIRHRNKEVAHV
jgi:hypothetical protein